MDRILIKRNRSIAVTPWATGLVLLGALILRLWHLGARSIWTDEGSTWTAARASLPELIRLCAQKDASPPLYYLLTSMSLRFGDGEVALRFVSVLASVGLVWLTYRIARLFVGRPESALAASLTALSPFQILYAQEARTYALVSLFVVWSLFFFLRAAVMGRSRSWWGYIIVSTLGLYTQSIFLLGIGVQAAIVALHPEARRRMLFWLFALGAVALLYLPWLFVSFTQMSRLDHSHWYLSPPGGQDLFRVLRTLVVSPIPLVTPPSESNLPGLGAWMPARLAQAVLIIVMTVPLLAAARAALVSRPRAWRLRGRGADDSVSRAQLIRFSLIAVVLPLLAVLVASFQTPLWLPRYFVFLSPFLSIALIAGTATLRPRVLGSLIAGLLLVVAGYGTIRYDAEFTKEPWREVVGTIAARSLPDSTAVLVPFDIDPFRFYNVKLAQPLAAFEVSHPQVPFASSYTPRQLDEMQEHAAERVEGFDDVWVVVRSPNSEVRREIVRRTQAVAAAGRDSVEGWVLTSVMGPLRVIRYQRGS